MQEKTSNTNQQLRLTDSGLKIKVSKKKGIRTSYTGIVIFNGQSITQKYRTVFK